MDANQPTHAPKGFNPLWLPPSPPQLNPDAAVWTPPQLNPDAPVWTPPDAIPFATQHLDCQEEEKESVCLGLADVSLQEPEEVPEEEDRSRYAFTFRSPPVEEVVRPNLYEHEHTERGGRGEEQHEHNLEDEERQHLDVGDENSVKEEAKEVDVEPPLCVVCYELTDTMTDCNHFLCEGCFRQLEKLECPYCRTEIYDDSILSPSVRTGLKKDGSPDMRTKLGKQLAAKLAAEQERARQEQQELRVHGVVVTDNHTTYIVEPLNDTSDLHDMREELARLVPATPLRRWRTRVRPAPEDEHEKQNK